MVTAVNVEEIHSVLEEDRATKVLFAASNSYYHYKCGCPRIEKTNQHATQLAFAERRNGLIRHVPLRDYDLADFRRGIFEILQQFGDLAAQVEVIFEDCLKFGTPEPVSSLEKKKKSGDAFKKPRRSDTNSCSDSDRTPGSGPATGIGV